MPWVTIGGNHVLIDEDGGGGGGDGGPAASSSGGGHIHNKYPKAGDTVDGLAVRSHVPNMGSIGASLGGENDYETVSGIREVPMSEFSTLSNAERLNKRNVALAEEIKQSGEINPLIVVEEKYNQAAGPYILEGSHRFDALRILGKKTFPAKVVIDLTTNKPKGMKMTEMKRAYAQLSIKAFDEEARTIRGIATTPQTDHQDDIVESKGASYRLPIPFLFAHDSKQPIGDVTKAVVTDAGIEIEAQIKKIPEPGKLKDRVDEAWQSIKYGLVRGLSIGFKDLESEPIKGSAWGRRIKKWSWLELSAVVIAANSEASITAIKEIDSHYRTASGHKPAGVTASKSTKLEVRQMPMTNADRMRGLEEKRAAEMGALEAIQNKLAEENRTKDEDEQSKFDDHAAAIKSIDRELSDCRLIEKELIAKAKPVNPDNGSSVEFHNPVIQVTAPKLEPGIGLIKQLACVLHANMHHRDVYAVAREYCHQWPQIEQSLRAKTAVALGTTTGTTYASPLVYAQNLVSEFIDLLWPMSVMGRIQGLRRVPFNSRIQRENSVISVEWVGEGRAKPVGALSFDTVSITFAKVALIIGLTDELARFSSPSAENLARDTLANGITKYIDEQFLSANAAVTNVSPAGILNGADTDAASGTDVTAVIHDIRQILAHYQVNNLPTDNLAIIMQPVLASSIASLYSSLSVPVFPNVSGAGGTILGLQVITSNNVPSGYIISMHPPSVAIADEGGLQIDASREASVELDDNATSGNYHLMSAFQSNLVFVRAERYISWARLRAKGVFYLTSAAYGGSITT